MKNVQVKVKGDEMTITVDLSKKLGKSASGKSLVIATSEGNQTVPEHPEIKFGLNVYTKAE